MLGALLLAWMMLSVGWAEDPSVARGELLAVRAEPLAAADRLHRRPAPRARDRGARRLRRRRRAGVDLRDPHARRRRRARRRRGRHGERARDRRRHGADHRHRAVASACGGRRCCARCSPCGAAICLAAVVLSLSRGGLVALGAALMTSVVVGGRRRIGSAVLVSMIGLAVIGYFAFGASDEARERVTTLGSGTGRTDIWTVGWRMVEARSGARRRRRQLPDVVDPLPARAGLDPARRLHRRPAAGRPQRLPARARRDGSGRARAVRRAARRRGRARRGAPPTCSRAATTC